MKRDWSTIKNIIAQADDQPNIFLSLIDESGLINCANSTMLRALELENPRTNSTNFFDLLHPYHKQRFIDTLEHARKGGSTANVELYIKNGEYHPMKWQVNCLPVLETGEKNFLCLGYQIVDDERLKKFHRLIQDNTTTIVEGVSGIIFHDERGELIAANHEAACLFNTSLEKLYQLHDVGNSWNQNWQIQDEEGRPVLFEEAPFRKTLVTGQPESRTLVIRMANGEDRWIRFYSRVLEDSIDTGERSVVTNLIDLTREKMLFSRLQEQEALVSAFIQQSPALAWVVDAEGTLEFASNAFYRYFKLDEKSCRGKRVMDLVPVAVTKAVYDKHIEVLETGKPLVTTEKVIWADGTQFLSHISIFPVYSATGRKLLGGQAVTLPDKSKLEKELQDVQKRLLTLSRATSDAIWEWDMQNGQIYRNEILMEMIGYQPDNSRGLSWWLRRIHPEDRNRVADRVKDATDQLLPSWQEEYRFKCADGIYKHVQDRGFVLYENGLPVKMMGSLQDISNLKMLQGELADERLQKQKEISETVIRVQEKERTRIGHELHDNVNQILSTAKLFMDMLTPQGKEQQLWKQKGADYLLMAIEEIRKLSKELVAPQLKEESLVDSISIMIEDIGMAHNMKISFKHDLAGFDISQGIKITLFRIVQEQLKNILKHSKASHTAINLQIAKDHQIELRISDNGNGFDPKQTHQGIGLANINERTLFYNGSVKIEAAPGSGCTLTVLIPI